MSDRVPAARGALWLTAGNLAVHTASFVRNMILARVLSKADFGIGAAFALVLTLFELTAKMGIGRCVIQDKEGNEPRFVANAHALQLLAGGVGALLIVLGAPWLAGKLGLAGHAWALTLLGMVTLCRGLEHVDVRRFERDLRFGPTTLVEAIPQVVIMLAAWPVAIWLADFRAVLVLLLVKSALACLLTHLLAERTYQVAWERERIVRILGFTWPLLITGFLMFGVMQGDQFLVATFYTMTDLGPYAAAAALAFAPSFLFGGVISSLLLPLLTRVRDDPPMFQHRYAQTLALATCISAGIAVGMTVGAEALMVIAYGPKYAGTGALLAWLCAAVAFRNLRIAPAAAALARGDSRNQMISNSWRLVAVVPMLALAVQGTPVWTLAACGLVGEVFAGWVSMKRLRRRDGIPWSVTLKPVLWVGLWLVLAGLVYALVSRHLDLWIATASAACLALASMVATVFVLPALRQELCRAWEAYRVGGWQDAVAQLQGQRPIARAGRSEGVAACH